MKATRSCWRFPFDYESIGIPFGSQQNTNCEHDPIFPSIWKENKFWQFCFKEWHVYLCHCRNWKLIHRYLDGDSQKLSLTKYAMFTGFTSGQQCLCMYTRFFFVLKNDEKYWWNIYIIILTIIGGTFLLFVFWNIIKND